MEVLDGIEQAGERHRGVVLTLGNFDGVHVGHQKILARVGEVARPMGAKTMAVTFDPHPVKVLFPERGVKLLTPAPEKARLLGLCGIDYVLALRFTKEFSKLTAEEFVEDVIVGRLAARGVVVGHNYAFGKGKRGTTDLLRGMGRRYGFRVSVVRNATCHGEPVSSSRIRSLVGWGRVCEAASLLGRPYAIEGVVVRGAGRGARLLGTPTANLRTENEVLPKEGVYAVRVAFEGRELDGVANIGKNPTFENAETSYEVHLLDFSGDLLGKALMVFFVERIREEKTYPSAGALHEQILRDIATAKEKLKDTPALNPCEPPA